MEFLEGAPVALGGTRGFPVNRTLPGKARRMVGAWCFLDAYGPVSSPMRVGPHPHTGLQTVTWLVSGSVQHRDSLGSVREIRPGQLNLMTAGRGVSHSEQSPPDAVLHGVQLWVALPHASRDVPPAFAHHGDLPAFSDGGVTTTVLMGSLGGVESPAACYSPLVGASVALAAGASGALPLDPRFEYAVLVLDGSASVAGVSVPPGPLVYLGTGLSSLAVAAGTTSQLLLLGGEPFEERLVMWWNFIGREHDEIVQMRADWEDRTPRFGTVHGYDGPSIPAPPMPITRLVPRGRVRAA